MSSSNSVAIDSHALWEDVKSSTSYEQVFVFKSSSECPNHQPNVFPHHICNICAGSQMVHVLGFHSTHLRRHWGAEGDGKGSWGTFLVQKVLLTWLAIYFGRRMTQIQLPIVDQVNWGPELELSHIIQPLKQSANFFKKFSCFFFQSRKQSKNKRLHYRPKTRLQWKVVRVIDIEKRWLDKNESVRNKSFELRSSHTLTDVAAYSKNGNRPGDQSKRSRFRPSAFRTKNISEVQVQGTDKMIRTPKTANMCTYTSSARWCTPVGNAGFRHWARRFATTSLRGISLNCM